VATAAGSRSEVQGPLIAKRRSPKIIEQYRAIGGKSPIGDWTRAQGRAMAAKLDQLSPATGPHKAYVAFRYAPPLTEEALLAMKEDGIERVVAFSQYPQFSCTTTGSSLNHLWRTVKSMGLSGQFQFSVIDRWNLHAGYIRAVVEQVRQGFAQLPDDLRDDATIVFTAHSLPVKVVSRGDQYPPEVCATVGAVMTAVATEHERWGVSSTPPFVMAWQSKVGPLPWQGPSTSNVLKGIGARGSKAVVVVPLGFTSDHIETLFEIDIEYREEAMEAGIEFFARAPSLNDADLLTSAQASIVAEHFASQRLCSAQYRLRCHGCTNSDCRQILDPVDDVPPR
jgi:protoporphyrin/coproporphyrin ferrochelatase